jgi:phosphatidylserine synthase
VGTTSSERLRGAGRFILRFLELQIPMALGAFVCYALGRLISDTSGLASAYHPGTYLFATGDVLFLTVPVVAWTLFRERRWRPSLEMALAMVAPVAMIALVGEVMRYPYLLWLVTGMYPAMCLGMIANMVYRRDRLTARAVSSTWSRVDRAI